MNKRSFSISENNSFHPVAFCAALSLSLFLDLSFSISPSILLSFRFSLFFLLLSISFPLFLSLSLTLLLSFPFFMHNSLSFDRYSLFSFFPSLSSLISPVSFPLHSIAVAHFWVRINCVFVFFIVLLFQKHRTDAHCSALNDCVYVLLFFLFEKCLY